MKHGRVVLLLASAWLAGGCQRGPAGVGQVRPEGERAVRTYLEKVIEAYRASDEQIVDPYVSEAHGLRLLGLIGVKRDAGITLDAELTELVVEGAERSGDDLLVSTRERWRYRDRKIGSGAQVGEASEDAYRLRYRFRREGGKLRLMETEFLEPPQVGRAAPRLELDVRQAHGLPPREEPGAGEAGPRGVGPPPGHPTTGTPPPGHPPLGPASPRPAGATP